MERIKGKYAKTEGRMGALNKCQKSLQGLDYCAGSAAKDRLCDLVCPSNIETPVSTVWLEPQCAELRRKFATFPSSSQFGLLLLTCFYLFIFVKTFSLALL